MNNKEAVEKAVQSRSAQGHPEPSDQQKDLAETILSVLNSDTVRKVLGFVDVIKSVFGFFKRRKK